MLVFNTVTKTQNPPKPLALKEWIGMKSTNYEFDSHQSLKVQGLGGTLGWSLREILG